MLLKKKPIVTTLKVVGYTLNILLAIMTILSAYGGVVDPEVSTLPAMVAMTFPIWLALTILTLFADLFLNRGMALIQSAVIVVCIGPILSFCPLNISRNNLTPEEKERSFTLLSYNVFGLQDYRHTDELRSTYDTIPMKRERDKGISNPTLSWIISQDRDIVCLQEFDFYVSKDKRYITRELYDSICRQYPYRVIGVKNGILSKFPLYPVNLPKLGSQTAFHLGAIAEIQGHRTLLISAHLQSIGLEASDKELYREITEGEGGKAKLKEAKTQLLSKLSHAFRERARQVEIIRHQIDSLGVENVIVCGDFNDIQDSYATRTVAGSDFKSAFTTAGFGPIITYHASRFYFHIDHILYRGDLEAIRFRKYNFERSDHYPIYTRFLWAHDAAKVDRSHKGIDLINRD